jgi:hypothetical protein
MKENIDIVGMAPNHKENMQNFINQRKNLRSASRGRETSPDRSQSKVRPGIQGQGEQKTITPMSSAKKHAGYQGLS